MLSFILSANCLECRKKPIMVSVIMLNVVMLSVVAPLDTGRQALSPRTQVLVSKVHLAKQDLYTRSLEADKRH